MSTTAQYLGTGKRKTSVARVILRPGDGKTWINGKTIEDYFPRLVHRKVIMAPLDSTELTGQYDLRVRVEKAAAGATEPQYSTLPRPPGLTAPPHLLQFNASAPAR